MEWAYVRDCWTKGGRKKGQRQIADVVDGYVVKDDIEMGYLNVVPLWNFGLCY